MVRLFNAKVVYEKIADEGKIVKVAENYIIEALTFSEAEARIIEEMEQFISGEFKVSKLTRSTFAEIKTDDTADRFYKVTADFISYNEETSKEVHNKHKYLVAACDILGAHTATVELLRGTLADYTILSIVDTDIVEVYRYIAPETDEKQA
jgi:hypothetical protein